MIRHGLRQFGALCFLLLFLGRPPGYADSFGGEAAAPGAVPLAAVRPEAVSAPVSSDRPDGPGAVWRWRRASLAELAGITVLGAGTLYSEAAFGKPKTAKWRGRNGLDESLRDTLRLGSKSARDSAGTVGDAMMWVLIAEPIADSFFTLGYRDRNWDALYQTSVINLESFTVSAFLSSVLQNSLRREKPFVRECPDGSCVGEQPNRGFPSGHVAFALTGAGLYCTHHAYQNSYDPATARAICGTSIALAAADGIARIMADRHYATDVIAGSAIGLFSGFLLPRLLHYDRPDTSANAGEGDKRKGLMKRMVLLPQVLTGGGAVNCQISF